MELKLTRKWLTKKSTIGELTVDGVFECFILEDHFPTPYIKTPAKTAIPVGKYDVVINFSPRFKVDMPLLLEVPEYKGVRIHTGNDADDTEGCLLPGQVREQDAVKKSAPAYTALFAKIRAAQDAGEKVSIEIVVEPVQAVATGSTFEAAIPVIMSHEGTPTNFWVNDPADPGGETVWGWSMRTILALGLTPRDLGLPQSTFTPGSLREVSKATCERLYKAHFWNKYGYGRAADQTVATKLMDAAVNMGPKRAAELAQRAANGLGASLEVDGSLGDLSFAAINACEPRAFIQALAGEMAGYYDRIIARNPDLAKFRKAWMRRAAWAS